MQHKPLNILISFMAAIFMSIKADSLNFLERLCVLEHPFKHKLAPLLIKAKHAQAPLMICCHGSGGNNRIAHSVKHANLGYHLLSFNFPDHDRSGLSAHSSFGTICELLPLLYILKKVVIDGNIPVIHLYGFSAGAGAVINVLYVLSTFDFSKELASIGLHVPSCKQILVALQKGTVILDCPLKSIEEIIAFRGSSVELEHCADRYRKNKLRPIDSILKWNQVSVKLLLHFQKPDEILSNRDDQECILRVNQSNKGKTEVVISSDGGHNSFSQNLWNAYQRFATSP